MLTFSVMPTLNVEGGKVNAGRNVLENVSVLIYLCNQKQIKIIFIIQASFWHPPSFHSTCVAKGSILNHYWFNTGDQLAAALQPTHYAKVFTPKKAYIIISKKIQLI